MRDEEADDLPVLGQLLTELDRERRLTRVRLAPLGRADVVALVRALVNDTAAEASAAWLADEAWSASEGNPFVAVEVVRARTEDRLSHATGASRLPERLRLLLGHRLDRLSARARHLATVAAAVGKDASLPLLALAAGMSEAEAEDEVAELVRQRIVVERPGGVGFTHEHLRDTALSSLPEARARGFHRRVAQ